MEKYFDRWLLEEKSVSYQIDFIVFGNIAAVFWVLYLIIFESSINITNGEGNLTIFQAFNTLFSAFASVMIILSWLGSKDLTRKLAKDGGFNRPEMDLVWASWAILFWQISTVVGFYSSGVEGQLFGMFFSSVNNMFFLWAVSDFEFDNNNNLLKKYAFFSFLLNRRNIFAVTALVILISTVFILFVDSSIYLFSKYEFLVIHFFDFIYSSICILILYLGFKGVIEERYVIRFLVNEPRHLLKSYVLHSILVIPFLITFVHGVANVFPEIGTTNFTEYTKNLALGILNQLYRCTIVVLFFLLEISWVRVNRDKVNKEKELDLALKNEIIKQRDLEIRNETLDNNRIKLQLKKERKKIQRKEGQIRTLRNEISHRFKNHLRALSVGVDNRIKKYDPVKNVVVYNELTAEKSRIEATLSVHEHLDKKGSSEDVNFYDYLNSLCIKLKDVFYFPPNGFVYNINKDKLDKLVSYADARGIGIALTELVINTDQHAYDNLSEKYIEINIEIDKDFYLSVKDKGKGVKGTMKTSFKDGSGFSFVSDIVKVQLKGAFNILDRVKLDNNANTDEPGVLFEIIIPESHLSFK